MKLKLLHIVTDDKFIDGAISLFECDERVDNNYIIIGKECPFKYIKCEKVHFVSDSNALDAINRFDAVVIHSLPAIPLSIIGKINNHIKVVWFAWGYDIYEKPYNFIPQNLYGPRTKKYLWLSFLKRTLFKIRKNEKEQEVKRFKEVFLRRIDYFSGVFPYEVDLLKQYHPLFHAQGVDFYYGSTTFFIPEDPDTNIVHGKKNIIIGNSGNPTGNHLDALSSLSSVSLDNDTKIIIPLSYGGTDRYNLKVEKEFNKIAPGRVLILRNYMPFNEYIDIISSCRAAIFAHERQQASDNIFLQMMYGARVYLSESSYAYKYLKEIGFSIFSYQNDIRLLNKELSEEEVMNNRRLLSSLYASSKLINRVKNIITTLMEKE